MRNGDVHSKYSDEELNKSDDSIADGVGKHQVAVVSTLKDNMVYVDKMTDRLNETDLRLLRHSINQDYEKDNEKYDESKATNQEFSMQEKVKKKADPEERLGSAR